MRRYMHKDPFEDFAVSVERAQRIEADAVWLLTALTEGPQWDEAAICRTQAEVEWVYALMHLLRWLKQ